MLKARRKEQIEPLKFPEPREGLPEDPRPFIGSQHLVAAASVQEHLNARCLVAVVGRLGSGKSTVCRRAANSRWARQWFLQDENGQPVHRRFWVDLEDAVPGRDTKERIAHALGRPTFAEALARLGNGRPCLLILDNADQAFGDGDSGDTLGRLVACVDGGASIIVSRRSLAGLDLSALDVGRQWTDIVEISGFASHDESKQLFDQLAPRHATGLRTPEVVAACDRLPGAVNLLANTVAWTDIEGARARIGAGTDRQSGLGFAVEVAAAMLDSEDRYLWGALSMIPSGLSGDDIAAVFPTIADARERTIRLFSNGVAQRCEAGVRIPRPLRLSREASGLDDVAVSDLWRSYVGRARAVVLPMPVAVTEAGADGTAGATPTTRTTLSSAHHSEPGGRPGPVLPIKPGETRAADTWLTRQAANLSRLASQAPLADGTFELACVGLDIHGSGLLPDSLDRALVRLLESGMAETDQPAIARLAASLENQRRFGTSALVATVLSHARHRSADTRGEAEALCQLGRSERFLGRYEDAEIHLSEARRHFEELDDAVGQGTALFELGQVDIETGRLDDADTRLGAALVLFEANGRLVDAAHVNLELVRVDLARGQADNAAQRLGDALDRYENAGDKLGFANACLQLGQVELARGRLDSAERRFLGALDGYEHAGDKTGFANAFLQLGQVELARGRLDSAERRFVGALAGFEQIGDQGGTADASLQLGQIDLARGRFERAGQRLTQALAAYEQLGDRIGVANVSLQLGQVDLGRGELEEADERLQGAQAAYDEIGDRMGSANSRQVAAMLRQAQDRRSDATELYVEAAQLYSSVGRTASAGWSFAGAARNSTEKTDRARHAADAVRLLEEAGLAEAAGQLAVELAKPAPQPQPGPETSGQQAPESEPWPALLREPTAGPLPHSEADVTWDLSPGLEPLPAPSGLPEATTTLPHDDTPDLPADSGLRASPEPQAPQPATADEGPIKSPQWQDEGTFFEPLDRVVTRTGVADFDRDWARDKAEEEEEEEDEEIDDEPDLLWAPLWSGSSETADSALLGEWTGSGSPRMPDPIGPPVEGWDVALWGEDVAPDRSAPGVDSVGQWPARDWGEGTSAEGLVGEWSPGHWSEATTELGDTDADLTEDELTRWEPSGDDTEPELFPEDVLDAAADDPAHRPDPHRRARFRWSRRKEHQADPPSLPGLEG